MGVTSEHLIQVTCSLSSLYSVLAFSLSSAWKERQNQNLKQNLNHNLKQNLNHFPLLGIHHTLVDTTSQVLIQGHGIGMDSHLPEMLIQCPGIGMDSHLPEVLIHGNYIGMDPQISTEVERENTPQHQTEQKVAFG